MRETPKKKGGGCAAEWMRCSQIQTPCQVSHTAPGPWQTLEITLATAHPGDHHVGWQDFCQKHSCWSHQLFITAPRWQHKLVILLDNATVHDIVTALPVKALKCESNGKKWHTWVRSRFEGVRDVCLYIHNLIKGIFRCKFNLQSNTLWHRVRPPPSRDQICRPLAYVVLATSEETAR